MKIKINNISWEIVKAKSTDDIMREKWGCCVYTEHRIYLLHDMRREQLLSTLIHELVHAYEYSFGLYDMQSDNRHEDLAKFIQLYGEQIIDRARLLVVKL